MITRYFLPIILFQFAALGTACADEFEGIYGCAGYISGALTNLENIELKMTLTIAEDTVYLEGDHHLFGTNILNPFDGSQYLNCGMKYPPEFVAYAQTCEHFTDARIPIIQDFAKLNMATMRLDVLSIYTDSM